MESSDSNRSAIHQQQTQTSLNWKKYFLELLSIFLAVTMAFALNKWNEDRKEARSEIKILKEISNGLKSDLVDLNENIGGHKMGVKSVEYFKKVVLQKEVSPDSAIPFYYYLLRDFVSIQNKSGYESLKSIGLDLITNDSLRLSIISVYDFHFEIIEKFEESYSELQFNNNYYHPINKILSPHMNFDDTGNLVSLALPLDLKEDEKQLLLSYLWRLSYNRQFVLAYYKSVIASTKKLQSQIEKEIHTLSDE